jgi:hypothetical protein
MYNKTVFSRPKDVSVPLRLPDGYAHRMPISYQDIRLRSTVLGLYGVRLQPSALIFIVMSLYILFGFGCVATRVKTSANGIVGQQWYDTSTGKTWVQWNPSPQPPPGTNEIQISLTQTGLTSLKAMTGQKVKGIGITSTELCTGSPTKVEIDSGWVYQAAYSIGWPLISDTIVPSIITRVQNLNPLNIATDTGAIASGIGAVLLVSKVIAATSPWSIGMVVASQGFNVLVNALKPTQPDPTKINTNLLTGTITIQPKSWVSKLALSRYQGDRAPAVVTVKIP